MDTAADFQVPCTRREYSFDKNGNRTKSRTTSDAGGECFYAGGPVEVNHSYDGLDRPVKAGDGTDYVYDAFGRQRLIPESDASVPGAGDIDVSYFDDDLAHTISQNDVTTTFALDVLGRRKTSTITGQPTQTRHYGDDSDNPAWVTNSDGMLTRMTASLDGLGAMVVGDGTAALALGNPHGDNVTTTVVLAPAQPETQDAVSITGWIDYDEYGRSKTGHEAGIGYGWLGKHERATSIESAGLTLMGVRLYNPARGAFTSTDPVRGGNTTAYTYPQDPIGMLDTDGLASKRKMTKFTFKLSKLAKKRAVQRVLAKKPKFKSGYAKRAWDDWFKKFQRGLEWVNVGVNCRGGLSKSCSKSNSGYVYGAGITFACSTGSFGVALPGCLLLGGISGYLGSSIAGLTWDLVVRR